VTNDLELLKTLAIKGRQYLQHPAVKQILHADLSLEELQQYLATEKMTLTLLVVTTYLVDVHKMFGKIVGFGRKTLQQVVNIMNTVVTGFRDNEYHRVMHYRTNASLPRPIRTLQGMFKTLRDLDSLSALLQELEMGPDNSLAFLFEYHPFIVRPGQSRAVLHDAADILQSWTTERVTPVKPWTRDEM
ncbi:hypothetical protein GGF32_007086, partial [Allomyces javanicus]